MSAQKKKPYEYPQAGEPKPRPAISPSSKPRDQGDAQIALRKVKMEAESLKEKLQSSIMDNPKLAKKSAVLISLWVNGKNKKFK